MGKNKNSFYTIVFAVLAIGGFAAFFASHIGKHGDEAPALSYNEKTVAPAVYTNIDFKVTLRYPQSWKPDVAKGGFHGNYLSFKGQDGFFAIDAIGAKDHASSIEDAVKNVAQAPDKPYGASPTVHPATIAGQDARYVLPSTDQPAAHKNEAALIVKYPKPTLIGNNTFSYFMLYGDADHLQTIGESLQFLTDQ